MVTDVSPLRQFAPLTFCPWTYSTFTAYSVKTQASSFGSFQLLISQCAYVVLK